MKILHDLIQQLTEDVSLNRILFKARILAKTIGNETLNQWLESELYGYRNDTVPSYRILGSEVRGNLSNGFLIWSNHHISVGHLPERDKKELTSMKITNSVSYLESFINSRETHMKEDVPQVYYPVLSRGLRNKGVFVEYARKEVSKPEIMNLINSVRSKLLDLSLKVYETTGDKDNFTNGDLSELHTKITTLFSTSFMFNLVCMCA